VPGIAIVSWGLPKKTRSVVSMRTAEAGDAVAGDVGDGVGLAGVVDAWLMGSAAPSVEEGEGSLMRKAPDTNTATKATTVATMIFTTSG